MKTLKDRLKKIPLHKIPKTVAFSVSLFLLLLATYILINQYPFAHASDYASTKILLPISPCPTNPPAPTPAPPCVLGAASAATATYQDVSSDVHISGNVGIGNTAPLGPLAVGDATTVGSDGYIVLGKKTSNGWNREARIGYDNNYNLILGDFGAGNSSGSVWTPQLSIAWQAPANDIVVNQYGNIGLGTVNPIEQLDLTGSIHLNGANNSGDSPAITLNSADQWTFNGQSLRSYGFGFHTDENSTNWGPYISGWGGIEMFTNDTASNIFDMTQAGNVGIGTSTPWMKLDVQGSLDLANNNSASTNRIYLSSGDANHYIYSTGSGGNNMYFGEYGANFHFTDTSNGSDAVAISQGAYSSGGIKIGGSNSLSGNANGWIYVGDGSNTVYGNQGLAANKLWANSTLCLSGKCITGWPGQETTVSLGHSSGSGHWDNTNWDSNGNFFYYDSSKYTGATVYLDVTGTSGAPYSAGPGSAPCADDTTLIQTVYGELKSNTDTTGANTAENTDSTFNVTSWQDVPGTQMTWNSHPNLLRQRIGPITLTSGRLYTYASQSKNCNGFIVTDANLVFDW